MPYERKYKNSRSYSRSRSRSRHKRDNHKKNNQTYVSFSRSSKPAQPRVKIDWKFQKNQTRHHRRRSSSYSSSSDSSSSSSYSSSRSSYRNRRRQQSDRRGSKIYKQRERSKQRRYQERPGHNRYEGRRQYSQNSRPYEQNQKYNNSNNSRYQQKQYQKASSSKFSSRQLYKKPSPPKYQPNNYPRQEPSYKRSTYPQNYKRQEQHQKPYFVPINSEYKKNFSKPNYQQQFKGKQEKQPEVVPNKEVIVSFENKKEQEVFQNKEEIQIKEEKPSSKIVSLELTKRLPPQIQKVSVQMPEKQKVPKFEQKLLKAKENLKIKPIQPNFLLLDTFKTMSKFKSQTLENSFLEILKEKSKNYEEEKTNIFTSQIKIQDKPANVWITVPQIPSDQELSLKSSLEQLSIGTSNLGEILRKGIMLE